MNNIGKEMADCFDIIIAPTDILTVKIELDEKEVRVLLQTVKIWLGEFPDTNCKPSLIWANELKELKAKLMRIEQEFKPKESEKNDE